MRYPTFYKIYNGALSSPATGLSYTHDAEEARAVYLQLAKEGAAYLESQVDDDGIMLGEWDLVATNVEADAEYIDPNMADYRCPKTSSLPDPFVVVGCGYLTPARSFVDGVVTCIECGHRFKPGMQPETVYPR